MRELPSWAELRHQNLLPFHGVYFFRSLVLKASHGDAGMVTDIGQRLYMVSGPSSHGTALVNPMRLGIPVAGKWESA